LTASSESVEIAASPPHDAADSRGIAMRIRFAAAALCAGIAVPTVAAEIPLADC